MIYRKENSQTGFGHLGTLLGILVIAVIAFVAVKLEQSRNSSDETASTVTPSRVQQVPAIKTKADLDTAEKTLNSANIDGDLSPSSFNQDISDLQ